MIPLYTEEQFKIAKSMDKLSCKCNLCNKPFLIIKKLISHELKHNNGKIKYCSKECLNNSKIIKITVNCFNCQKKFEKLPFEFKKSPNHFCSRSCSATYNNKNKTTGTRRSKLEIWLQTQLPTLYPNLEFQFNRKDAIGSELDIYIPSLSLAFELNGIFHYEPIYGDRKLGQIQVNDQNKYKACLNHQIDLCIIDASQFKKFKPEKASIYLDIIDNIIKERLLTF